MFFLLKSTIVKIFTAIGALAVGSFMLAAGFVFWFFASLPNVESLKGCLTTEMNKVRLCEKDASYVQLDSISSAAIGAVLVSEDAAFFDHDGIDPNEIKESFVKNINEGRFARGGSTITQQLAKNVFLSSEKSLLRKGQEVYLAFQIEKIFTKKKILTMYLNVVEFGENIYGIKKASQHYFNKEPASLLPEEGAFLAFLLPNPKKYSQSFAKKQLTDFANKSIRTILHKMYRARKLTEPDYISAKQRASNLFGKKAEASTETEQLNEEQLDEIIQQEEPFKLEQEQEVYENAPQEI